MINSNAPYCKICHSATHLIFRSKVLQKYYANYFKCDFCQFIQTEEPYWINESYQNAITDLDLGLLMRNLYNKGIVKAIIDKLFKKNGVFLDYGGGYGLFVRLMRDAGYNFYRQDNYCENLFARHFDINDIFQKDNFELLTCFEVFEHLTDPLIEIEKMLQYSHSILFSTTLQPTYSLSPETWDYFAPETGQHIAFYTKNSLEFIAKKYGLNLYTNNSSLHLLTNNKWSFNWVKYISFEFILINRLLGNYFNNKETLLYQDVHHIKELIKD